jgi:hypothetical protein
MSDLSFQPQTEADFEALFAHQIAEMRLLNERMQRDREQIDHHKAETDVLREDVCFALSIISLTTRGK